MQSLIADGPESDLRVFDRENKLQTWKLVLSPTSDALGFQVLDYLVGVMDPNDPRYTELEEWRDRLRQSWREKLVQKQPKGGYGE